MLTTFSTSGADETRTRDPRRDRPTSEHYLLFLVLFFQYLTLSYDLCNVLIALLFYRESVTNLSPHVQWLQPVLRHHTDRKILRSSTHLDYHIEEEKEED